MALAYRYLSYVHLLRREVDEGRRWAEKQVEISKKLRCHFCYLKASSNLAGRSLSMGMWRKASNRHATG
jgi:hypothetical protein